MTHDQVNIELWKIWEPYFGCDNNLGMTLIDMQRAQCDNECMGIRITEEQLHQIKSRCNDDMTYPILYEGTTRQDYNEALWVHNRVNTQSTLYGDLDQYRDGVDDGDMFDCGSGYDPWVDMQDTETFISDQNRQLQDALKSSCDSSSTANLTIKEKEDLRKEAIDLFDSILNDPLATKKDVTKIVKSIAKRKNKVKRKIFERVGKCNREDEDGEGAMQWSGIDSTDTVPEKRKKNVLG